MEHTSRLPALWRLHVAAVLLMVSVSAKATLVGVTPTAPDMQVGPITLNYDAGTNTLTGTSTFPLPEIIADYDPVTLGSGNYDVIVSAFSFTVGFDETGFIPGPGNTISISGFIPDLGIGPGELLTATLVNGGIQEGVADSVGPAFDFVADPLSITGALAAEYAAGLGIVLVGSQFDYDWGTSTQWTTTAQMDITTPAVPLPSALMLLLFGLPIVGAHYRKTRKARS